MGGGNDFVEPSAVFSFIQCALYILYVWLVYSMMYLNTLRLSHGNTKLSESVWLFKEKSKSNFATGNKSSFS